MEYQLVITKDGSASVFNPEFDEHYHSIHGALQESQHVFINNGLSHICNGKNKLHILDIGFGTALNTLLTYKVADEKQLQIDYIAIEKFPLPSIITEQLNFSKLSGLEKFSNIFIQLHQQKWDTTNKINSGFLLTKCKMDIAEVDFTNTFDLIYFDAFAPSAQPELWTKAIFMQMYKALKADGILVTYCAKGIVKRTLKEVGFQIEALPGPIGKREMTRAAKRITEK